MTNDFPLDLPDQEWRKRLDELEYHVLRESGTEAPFTGEYTDTTAEGVYECRACGTELFRSEAKFSSHCGWPSFFEPLTGDRVIYLEDHSIPGRPRVEVRCAAIAFCCIISARNMRRKTADRAITAATRKKSSTARKT